VGKLSGGAGLAEARPVPVDGAGRAATMATPEPLEETVEAWMRDEIGRVHGPDALQQLAVRAERDPTVRDQLGLYLRYQQTNEESTRLAVRGPGAAANLEAAVREAVRTMLTRAGLPAQPQSVTDAARRAQQPDPMVEVGGTWADR
jgi:hypothetical protein